MRYPRVRGNGEAYSSKIFEDDRTVEAVPAFRKRVKCIRDRISRNLRTRVCPRANKVQT